MNRRGGFTFVEIMISMIIVGLLSSIAVPKYIDLKRKAWTTQIVGDFEVVRIAAISFYADSSYFPVEADAGVVPQNLDKYLPKGFKFRREYWSMDYDKWDAGGSGLTTSGDLVGVSLVTDDESLRESTRRMVDPNFANGDKVTFIINGQ